MQKGMTREVWIENPGRAEGEYLDFPSILRAAYRFALFCDFSSDTDMDWTILCDLSKLFHHGDIEIKHRNQTQYWFPNIGLDAVGDYH